MAFAINNVQAKKPLKQKDQLLAARVDKILVEVAILKKAAKVSGDTIAVSELAPFLTLVFNDVRNTFQRLLVSLSVRLAECSTPVQCNKAMSDAFNAALDSLARQTAERKIEVGKIKLDPPIEGLAWWLKGHVAQGSRIPAGITVEQLAARYADEADRVRFSLFAIPAALAPKLEGKSTVEIEKEIGQAISDCLRHLSEGGEAHA